MGSKLNIFLQRLKLAGKILVKGKPSNYRLNQIPQITPEELVEIKMFFPMEKFFIFGHARSGTTLLVRLIRVHQDVHCNYQGHFFTRPPFLQSLVKAPEIREWFNRRSNRWNHGRDLSPVVLRSACDFIMERDARRVGKRIVGDKSPNGILNGTAVQLLHEIYPDAKLIFIIRDGRDVVLSHRFQTFIDAPQHLSSQDKRIKRSFAADPVPFLSQKRSIFTEKGIENSTKSWVANVLETNEIGRKLYGDCFISIRYEDLLNTPRQVMNEIWSFLDADISIPALHDKVDSELKLNPDADWRREKAGDLIKPLQSGKNGSWKDLFSPKDRDTFKAIAGKTLIEWGYEDGSDW